MTTYQTIRKRGLRTATGIPSHLIRVERPQDADPDDDADNAYLYKDQRRISMSLPPRVFGRAICDEAHYIQKVNSMTTHAIWELQVQSFAYLTGTPMINGAPAHSTQREGGTRIQ